MTPSIRQGLLFTIMSTLIFGSLLTAAPNPGQAKSIREKQLEKEVSLALLEKLGHNALAIKVSCKGNKVRLSGSVPSRATQELAKEVALTVKGVKRVKNRVSLDEDRRGTPVGYAVGDAEREVKDGILETRVASKLISELGRYGLKIEVESVDGTVSLRGKLDATRKQLALETAKDMKGVNEVIDLIEISNR